MAVSVSNRGPGLLTAGKLRALLRPGLRVYIQGSIGQPCGLIAMLSQAAEGIEDLHYISILTPGLNQLPLASRTAETRLSTYFDYRDLRTSFTAGRIDFAPTHYSRIVESIRAGGRLDVALIQVAPPNHDGRCSLGICADFVPDLLPNADLVLAEINASYPAVQDGPSIALDAIDYCVCSDRPLIETPPQRGTNAQRGLPGTRQGLSGTVTQYSLA